MQGPSTASSRQLTWNWTPRALVARTRRTASAVRTGTVDFSTTTFGVSATSAILRAHSSQFLMLAALPAPIPVVCPAVPFVQSMPQAGGQGQEEWWGRTKEEGRVHEGSLAHTGRKCLLAGADPRLLSVWPQGAGWVLPVANEIPRVSLKG